MDHYFKYIVIFTLCVVDLFWQTHLFIRKDYSKFIMEYDTIFYHAFYSSGYMDIKEVSG